MKILRAHATGDLFPENTEQIRWRMRCRRFFMEDNIHNMWFYTICNSRNRKKKINCTRWEIISKKSSKLNSSE